MLTEDQIRFYRTQGFLVVEDVLDQRTVLDPVRREYAAIINRYLELQPAVLLGGGREFFLPKSQSESRRDDDLASPDEPPSDPIGLAHSTGGLSGLPSV